MRKPVVGKPRSANAGTFSLSRKLPRLRAPLSAAAIPVSRPHPTVGRPGGVVSLAPHTRVEAPVPADVREGACRRCGHDEEDHPVRYVCDKYPHPDPLQICGCERETLDELCVTCGHKGRHHKPRHRCRVGAACGCWGYDGD
jgi:hypothetical protein